MQKQNRSSSQYIGNYQDPYRKKQLPTNNVNHCYETDHFLTIFTIQYHQECIKQLEIILGRTVIQHSRTADLNL
jgi:hypothetical protein